MVNGEFVSIKLGIIMDYNAPADTTTTVLLFGLSTTTEDPVQFQIIDVTGRGSRRIVALTVNGRVIG